MKHTPSREANKSPADQDISCILWNLNVHYRVHSSPPHAPVLSQISPDHALFTICFNSILTSKSLSSKWSLAQSSPPPPPNEFLKRFCSPPHVLHAQTHLVFIYFVNRISGEEYRSRASSSCIFLRSLLKAEVRISYLYYINNTYRKSGVLAFPPWILVWMQKFRRNLFSLPSGWKDYKLTSSWRISIWVWCSDGGKRKDCGIIGCDSVQSGTTSWNILHGLTPQKTLITTLIFTFFVIALTIIVTHSFIQ